MKLTGNTILITGGGSGIGLAIAKALLKQDNKVIVCGRNLEKLEKVKADHPGLEVAQCDVTNDEQIKALLQRCNDEFGGINVLINNAGVFHMFNYAKGGYPIEKQQLEVDIDVMGPIRMVHYFLPDLMKKDSAAIVNVSSGLAYVPLTSAPVYSATKAANHAWTRSLRFQLQKSSVKVIELLPPVVDTEMVADIDFPKISPEKLADEFIKGFAANKPEITPGQASQLKMMSRLAPGFIFNQINKDFA